MFVFVVKPFGSTVKKEVWEKVESRGKNMGIRSVLMGI
jgi:hypothetical protein